MSRIPNNYNGEMGIRLDDKDYVMTVNMDVIGKFESETGVDFMNFAMRAMRAAQMAAFEKSALACAEMMTKAVPMKEAVYLFYLAANAKDQCVELNEMQENVLREGPMQRVEAGTMEVLSQSYPTLVARLVTFAVLGVEDSVKKPL